MSPDPISDRWDEVDRLFGEALPMGVAEREAFLTDACGDDVPLFETVSRLLEASRRGEEALSGPPEAILREAFASHPRSEARRVAGTDLGPYRLLREVKRGGMATVYEARRADGAFDRRVAIKVLEVVGSEELTRRFLAERQILSDLSHPNIADVLDGGTTGDGQPYLVLEWIDGDSITRWADARSLDLAARLRLAQQVAEAVQYAHSHLVVHRDIKPSNVLVDDEGRVRLLDFGIAKLMASVSDDDTPTRPATRWMTPEYAAPEQILGRPVTTATDVYALGALIHELATSRRPFAGEGDGTPLEGALGDRVPRPMSTVLDESDAEVARLRGTTPRRLRRSLEGDLDAIVAKALRHRPDERYRSVRELSDDIDRHLGGRPVSARVGLRRYRAGKFLRRHWVALGTAAAIFAFVSVSAVLLAQARDRAESAAARAAAESADRRIVIDFLADIFRGRDPAGGPGDTMTARELLAWGSERVDAEFGDRPALRADLLLVLAEAHRNLGLLDESVDLSLRAVEARRARFGNRSEEVAAGLMELGRTYTAQRRFGEAAEARREALEIRRELDTGDSPLVAASMGALAVSLRDLGRPDSAEALLRQALAIRRAHPDDEAALTGTLLDLAYVLRALERFDEAEGLYEEGIARYRASPERDDGALALYLNNLAYLHRVRDDFGAAETLYRESLALQSGISGPGHPQALMLSANLAGVLAEQGRIDDAASVLRDRIAAAHDQWPDGHWRVAAAHAALARALLRAGDLAEAEAEAGTATGMYADLLGPQHDWTSFAGALVAVARLAGGESAEGRAYLDRLHDYLVGRRADSDGSLDAALVQQLEPFLRVLEATGLDEQHRRFRGLLER